MRIITGSARGTTLKTLPGEETRPTAERVKEAMFSAVQFELGDRSVLELFGGCGQLSLEALSRGAESATIVDASRAACEIIKENAVKTKLFDRCRVVCSDWKSFVKGMAGRASYSLLLLDPPYKPGAVDEILSLVIGSGLLTDDAVVIAYASVYGGTENAANVLAAKLSELGVRNVQMYDVSVTPASDIIAECFRWSHLVFASATYNGGIFVTMDELLRDIAAHNLQKRTVAFMENGTWAPVSARQMAAILAPLKNMTVLEQSVAIRSSLTEGQLAEIEALADVIAEGIR